MILLYFLLLLLVFLFIYKKVYFKPITVLKIGVDGSFSVVSIKPVRSWLRSISSGSPIGFVMLSSNIAAIYIDSSHDPSIRYLNYNFSSDLYILRYSKFKFASVNLSDRVLSDCISKFQFI